MKLFKRFTVLLAAALSAVCLGIFAAACDTNGDTNDDTNKNATEFTITVYYSDGTTVVNGTKDPLTVQICDASGNFCYNTAPKVSAEGKVTFDIATIETAAKTAGVTGDNVAFVLHVWDNESDSIDSLPLKDENATVSKSNPTVKLVLKDREAPKA